MSHINDFWIIVHGLGRGGQLCKQIVLMSMENNDSGSGMASGVVTWLAS